MGLGIFIKMTLGVVRKEFELHGWRAKHHTWGTTKGLCKPCLPRSEAELSMLFPRSVQLFIEICGKPELKGIFPGDGGGRWEDGGEE